MSKSITSIIIFLTLASISQAQGVGVNASGQIRTNVRDAVRERNVEVKDAMQAVKDTVRGGVEQLRDLRVQDVANFQERREELQNTFKTRREEFKQNLESIRETTKTRIEAARTKLKERLGQIKDERKKALVEKIGLGVNELNQRLTDQMAKYLDHLDDVLERISSRIDKGETNGLDVSTAKTALVKAEEAIVKAKKAVTDQAAKAYEVSVTTEANLKVDVGGARKALHDDLTKVKEVIAAAREAVRQVATTLAQIPRIDEAEVSASSTTQVQSGETTSTPQ